MDEILYSTNIKMLVWLYHDSSERLTFNFFFIFDTFWIHIIVVFCFIILYFYFKCHQSHFSFTSIPIHFEYVTFKYNSVIYIGSISCKIALRRLQQYIIDYESIMCQLCVLRQKHISMCDFVHKRCCKVLTLCLLKTRLINPDSKVHGTKMGPTWALSAPGGPHVGPINHSIRVDKLHEYF